MELKYFLIFIFLLFSQKRVQSQNANCPRAIDLVLIVDSSGSVGVNFFDQAKAAMVSIINRFNINENNALIGLINYSSHVETVLSFILQNLTWSQQLVTSAINNMVYFGQGTASGEAIYRAREIFNQSRENVPKLAIIFTDGKSNGIKNVLIEAQLLKDEGVDIFAIGIGNGVNQIELETIASIPKPTYHLQISGYNALFDVVNNITQIACNTNVFIELDTPIGAETAFNEQNYYQVNLENYHTEGYAHIRSEQKIGRTNIYFSIFDKNPKTSNPFGRSTTLKDTNDYFVYIPANTPRLYLSIQGIEENNEIEFEVNYNSL